MKIHLTPLSGVLELESTRAEDARGSMTRLWCREEMARAGIDSSFAQSSLSANRRRGTLRGMHYQADPWSEAKLVRCVRGSAFDVALDLRAGSPTWGRWFGALLDAQRANAMYLPEGVAHGYQTLEDDTEMLYEISAPHHPEAARGVRWDDPLFRIEWPIHDPILSERDASWASYQALMQVRG